MQELEKILEEIDNLYVDETDFGIECNMENRSNIACDNCYECIKEACKNIIRNHVNDGWIPVERGFPEVNRTPEEDDECPEFNVTIRGAEKATALKYSPADHTWFDDMGYVYDVIAWRPMPEVYRPADKTERSEQKCFCGCVL